MNLEAARVRLILSSGDLFMNLSISFADRPGPTAHSRCHLGPYPLVFRQDIAICPAYPPRMQRTTAASSTSSCPLPARSNCISTSRPKPCSCFKIHQYVEVFRFLLLRLFGPAERPRGVSVFSSFRAEVDDRRFCQPPQVPEPVLGNAVSRAIPAGIPPNAMVIWLTIVCANMRLISLGLCASAS
jgi:hypothetical protein